MATFIVPLHPWGNQHLSLNVIAGVQNIQTTLKNKLVAQYVQQAMNFITINVND